MGLSASVLAVVAVLATTMAAAAPRTADIPQEVRAALVATLRGRLGPDVTLEFSELTCRLTSDTTMDLTATPEPSARLGGTIRFTLTAAGARGHAMRIGEATALVNGTGPFIRTTRAVSAGHSLTAEDIELRVGPIADMPLKRLPTLAESLGARTNRPLGQHETIVVGSIAPVSLVHVGQHVRITVRSGAVEAVLVGVAEQNGALEQVIRVVNPDSRRVLRARVMAEGEVEVVNGQ